MFQRFQYLYLWCETYILSTFCQHFTNLDFIISANTWIVNRDNAHVLSSFSIITFLFHFSLIFSSLMLLHVNYPLKIENLIDRIIGAILDQKMFWYKYCFDIWQNNGIINIKCPITWTKFAIYSFIFISFQCV